jgi:hypothetical protein
VLTRAKEKHADVVDGLSRRQLESGFGFVDLLQIRLQKSSGYAATKHRSGVSGAATRSFVRFVPVPRVFYALLAVVLWSFPARP